MSFRWPIIRSSWKSYGNVSVHSVSNCKILGPNFLIRAWNGNQNDGQGLKHIYSLNSPSKYVSHWKWARFSKKELMVAPAKSAHMQTNSAVHRRYILACKIYQCLDACTTVCFTCRFKYSAHAIGQVMVGCAFCWCNLYTFFKNIWPFYSFEPHVLPFCTYNPPTVSSFPEKLIAMYLLSNKEVSLLPSGLIKKPA